MFFLFQNDPYSVYRPDMSADQETLKRWFTLRDIFDYKYECRRLLDKLVGWENREPTNEQGKAERYGYTDNYDEALKEWRALTDKEKQKRVETPKEEQEVEAEEESEVTNDAAEETDPMTDLVPEQVQVNGVHQDDAIDEEEKTTEVADAAVDQVQENGVSDTQDTPPEVSPQ